MKREDIVRKILARWHEMTETQAYAVLGLDPEFEFYKRRMAEQMFVPMHELRQLGTTTRMCVAAAIATYAGPVVIRAHSPHYEHDLARKIEGFARRLGVVFPEILTSRSPEWSLRHVPQERQFRDHYYGT